MRILTLLIAAGLFWIISLGISGGSTTVKMQEERQKNVKEKEETQGVKNDNKGVEVVKQYIESFLHPENKTEANLTIIRKNFEEFGEEVVNEAIAISKCESGLRANAVGDTALTYVQDGVTYGESYGLFQIRYLPGRPAPEQLLDPEFNAQWAANKYRTERNWSAWSCYLHGGYRAHLPQ